MVVKIINSLLILFALFMGIKQGWAMVSGKQEMADFLGKLNVGSTEMMVLGGITMVSALLVLFPKTFLIGNFLTAAGILYIMALELQHRDVKGAMIEIPFLLLSLVIIYLGHPLAKTIGQA